MASIANLPEDGVPAEIISVHEGDCDDNVNLQSTQSPEFNDTHSF